MENSSSGVIVIKIRIEICTSGIFCDLTKPSLHIVSKGQTSIVELFPWRAKKFVFAFEGVGAKRRSCLVIKSDKMAPIP